jgi:hypothetical protein
MPSPRVNKFNMIKQSKDYDLKASTSRRDPNSRTSLLLHPRACAHPQLQEKYGVHIGRLPQATAAANAKPAAAAAGLRTSGMAEATVVGVDRVEVVHGGLWRR